MVLLNRTVVAVLTLFSGVMWGGTTDRTPEYTPDGQLKFPANYREWIFLSSGSGMTYGPLAAPGRQSLPMFDNVFVNPDSYRDFLKTGRCPDKTVFILEVRSAEGHASINNGGHFQRDIVGIEAEVKDSSAASGTWTFYGFPLDSAKPAPNAKAVPQTATCYTCHGKNTAVENTFVQFYPVLYDVAERKGTLKPGFEMPITSSKLVEIIRTQGWPAAEKLLTETSQRSPDAAVLTERSLNTAGYRLLGDGGNPSGAAALLEWTANRYPKSANVQDSLADPYLATGNTAISRRATEKDL